MSANQRLDVLRNSIYSTPDGLAARASIYQWQSPQIDLPKLAIDALGELTPGSLVLDAGCGRGQCIRRLRQTHRSVRCLALDASIGMAQSSSGSGIQPLVGSVAALPLTDGSVDAALAMHMLYHLPDPVAALTELRRVLKPGGVLVASTNDDVPGSLQRMFTDAGVYVAPVGDHWPLRAATDTTRAAGFTDVVTHPIDYQLTIPDVEPVLAYLDSCRAGAEVDDIAWEASRERVRQRVERSIDVAGVFVASGRVGFIVGRCA